MDGSKKRGGMVPHLSRGNLTGAQNLRKVLPESEQSVHWCLLPEPDASAYNESIEKAVERMWNVIEMVCSPSLKKGLFRKVESGL